MALTTALPAGNPLLTVHRPSSTIWVVELHNGVDNRLTDRLITQALLPALDLVEKEWRNRRRSEMQDKQKNAGKGALILSGAHNQDKFFSNGLDYASAINLPYFFSDIFNPLIGRLLGFPMPTIAAINGHAFAGGWLLALCCDYRVMIDGTKRRAWACMNEIHFGAPIPRAFATLLKAKCSTPRVLRQTVLEGVRFTPEELLDTAMVDVLGSSTKEVLSTAQELGDKFGVNAGTGVWGLIKRDIYTEVFESLGLNLRQRMPEDEDRLALAKL